LNCVELQNGCLALRHANTFIPSTLSGSCIDLNSGSVDENKLEENLSMAINAYISRVDNCPVEIALFAFIEVQNPARTLRRS